MKWKICGAVKRLNRHLSDFEFKKRRAHLFSRPWSVQMDVTTRCNLRCIMCSRHEILGNGEHMELELLRKIEKQILRYCSHILIGTSGECMLYPHFDELLHMLAKSPFTYRKMITNATLMNERCARQLVDMPMTEITISTDAYISDTLLRVRKGIKPDVFIGNLQFLADYRRSVRNGPKLNANCVIMPQNVEQLPDMVRFLGKLGFHSMGLTTPFGMETATDGSGESVLFNTDESRKIFREIHAEIRRIATESGIALTFLTDDPELNVPFLITEGDQTQGYPENQLPECGVDGVIREAFPGKQPNVRCEAPWVYTNIDPAGNISACCQALSVKLGSLKQDSFYQAWNSRHYKTLRRSLSSKGLYGLCYEKPCYHVPGSKQYKGATSDAPQSLNYECLDIPEHLTAETGETFSFDVHVKNTGDTLWLSTPHHGPGKGRVNIGVRVRKLPDEFGSFDDLRHQILSHDLLPGDESIQRISCPELNEPGEYEVQFTLVDELIQWFDTSPETVKASTVKVTVN